MVLEKWIKERGEFGLDSFTPFLKRVRTIGPTEAKVVVYLYGSPNDVGNLNETADYILTVFLTYHDGLWTAVRFEWSYEAGERTWNKPSRFLMDAIDEAAEKTRRVFRVMARLLCQKETTGSAASPVHERRDGGTGFAFKYVGCYAFNQNGCVQADEESRNFAVVINRAITQNKMGLVFRRTTESGDNSFASKRVEEPE